jgi:hypothetical protein
MRQCTRITSFVLLVLTLLSLSGTKSHAQEEPLNITTSPVFFDFTVDPGDTINDRIRVYNNNSTPATLTVSLRSLGPDEAGNMVIKDQNDADDPAIQWVKVEKTITAKPREWTNIPFTVAIPKDAAFGYSFAIAMRQDPTKAEGTTPAKLSGESAVPILLTVNKDGATAKAEVVEFRPENTVNEYLPVTFTTKVKNAGNIRIRPRGNIFIRDFRDQEIATLEVNENFGTIIPNTNRVFTNSWGDGFAVREPVMEDGQVKVDANGKPVTKLVLHWDKLTQVRMGLYKAYLILVYNDGIRDIPVEVSTTFWVIPYTFLIVVLVGVVGIIFLLRTLLTWYVRKEIRKGRSKRD